MADFNVVASLDPLTLVEGIARIVVVTSGNEVRALYQIMEFRGYEKLAIGRHVEDMPRLMSTICGVCSWSHQLASGKAVDAIFGRELTTRAKLTRNLVNYIQVLDSHLLHISFIGLPDLALWGEAERDIIKLMSKNPEVVSAALKTRSLLKQLEKKLVGKIQHGPLVVPGGVCKGITREEIVEVEKVLQEINSSIELFYKFFDERLVKSQLFKELLQRDEFTMRGYSMGLVKEGALELYDGALRVVDHKGRTVNEAGNPVTYADVIGEAMASWNYGMLPYYKPAGLKLFSEESTIFVGPLARLNVAEKVPGEKAGEEYKRLVEVAGGKPMSNVVLYHWARLVETLHCIEMINEIIRNPALFEGDVTTLAGESRSRGVGIVEAPRGILVHDYTVNSDFTVTKARVITPTTINNTAINTSLSKVSMQLAKEIKSAGKPSAETVTMLESIVRAYDPCNSCATHCMKIGERRIVTSFRIVVINEKGDVLWQG
ncbi:MAG: Ni/Fe hydrogenase subunit alpha [Ignisphaera sp.]|nr:Ni/Fe hydrogenase subunit alpha [Ignisphaera sp.]